MVVLDNTSSMFGLIASAKEKIWSIANPLASAGPAPAICMGLVGYLEAASRQRPLIGHHHQGRPGLLIRDWCRSIPDSSQRCRELGNVG